MLNFKTSSFLFISAILFCVLIHFLWDISIWWVLAPITLWKILIIRGSANIQSGFFIKAYCNANSSEKKIAITFDDGPDQRYTPLVLEILSKYKAPATFFVIGKNIKGNEALLKRVDAEGHIIGNHTFSHSFFIDLKSKFGFMFELDQTSDLVFNAIGKRMKFFRPPYGVTTPNLARASKALNYSVIGWSVRSFDTKKNSADTIIQRVKEHLKPGAIILFHDTSAKSVNVLEQTLNFAKENGFIIVSTGELLGIEPYGV
jgi:peptidoglycan/xylan/chitin deacetylase (PgdA/CDA1 family)